MKSVTQSFSLQGRGVTWEFSSPLLTGLAQHCLVKQKQASVSGHKDHERKTRRQNRREREEKVAAHGQKYIGREM